ncbi:MAG: hypothetical protein K2N52_01460, partial [Clostridia bacterium]|nr:hypothetical protein [Clostridia bacterium]
MSKIYYKVNDKKQEKPQKPAPDAENKQLDAQPAQETEKPAKNGDAHQQEFDKEKIVKYFKRHPKKQINYKVDRFSPNLKKGLSTAQVQTRFKQFLFNDTNKKYSRSYASIFIGNICTFFNLLCWLAGIALIIAHTQGITNYLVLFITTA